MADHQEVQGQFASRRPVEYAQQPNQCYRNVVLGFFVCVISANVELLWQAPFGLADVVEVHQDRAALHLRTMRAIIESSAHVVLAWRRAVPPRTHDACRKPEMKILQQRDCQLALHNWAYGLSVIHFVNLHDLLRALTLFAHTC